MRNKNNWEALSMRDRALLIREAVRNGITDIGSIRDTWEHRFDGNSSQPTEDEYMAQRAKERRSEALLHARNRTETIIPYIKKSPALKAEELEMVRMAQDELDRLKKEFNNPENFLPEYDERGLPVFKMPSLRHEIDTQQRLLDDYKELYSETHARGYGCLATIMDDYGKTETWNLRFAKDPQKSGFVEINQKDILPGDIVQFGDYYNNEWGPVHALMANTPYNEAPETVKFNGSNGGVQVRINSSYPVGSWEDNTKAYRYVGDKADSLQWKKEYREKYGHKFGGEDDTQQKTYISKKPKNNIKTGNVEFDFGDFDTWRYHNAPTYSKDTDFTLAFTDALLDKEKNFKWGDNYYSTEIDYNKKFTPKNGRKPFEEFADYMYPAVIQVLQENKMPVDMAHNIVRQAAMESDYGLSPRGKRGFNLSGIKWTKKAGDAGYEYTKEADGEKYIDFKDLKEYINYKIHTLNNNYNALNASSVYDYVEALHPKAFGKKPRSKNYKGDYSGGAANYKKSMTGMSSLDKTLMNELYFPLFRK
jgi:hypothetical protein